MAKSNQVFVVRQAFSPDGRHVVRRGTRVLANDALYKNHPGYFVAADADLVEQATAAPGEKRNLPLKADMLKAAKKVGADVSESDTKAEIAEAIAESIEG
jgi:hypothetical protein